MAEFQLYVKNTLLYNNLAEEVYIEQPHVYVDQEETIVCKLKKAIYGLKQSPQLWFGKFDHVVSAGGFKQCHSEHLVFIHHSSAGFVVLAIYIDVNLLTGSNRAGIEKATELLNTHFVIKDMGIPRYFLRIEISYSKQESLSYLIANYS